jgi:hypothetical protein
LPNQTLNVSFIGYWGNEGLVTVNSTRDSKCKEREKTMLGLQNCNSPILKAIKYFITTLENIKV